MRSKVDLVLDVRPAADEHLHVARLGLDHRLAEAGIVGRHVAPAEKLQALGLGRALDHGLAVDALRLVPRHEHMADGVVTGLGQGDAQRRGHHFQEFVRHLHEHASAVAGKRVGADGAAMGQIFEDLETVLDDRVARPRLQVGDEADAAGIMFSLRIVESLRRRRQS